MMSNLEEGDTFQPRKIDHLSATPQTLWQTSEWSTPSFTTAGFLHWVSLRQTSVKARQVMLYWITYGSMGTKEAKSIDLNKNSQNLFVGRFAWKSVLQLLTKCCLDFRLVWRGANLEESRHFQAGNCHLQPRVSAKSIKKQTRWIFISCTNKDRKSSSTRRQDPTRLGCSRCQKVIKILQQATAWESQLKHVPFGFTTFTPPTSA